MNGDLDLTTSGGLLIGVAHAVRYATELAATERHVLVTLASFVGKDEPITWVSLGTLAESTGRNEKTVRLSLTALKRAGWIVARRRAHDSTVYRIVLDKVAAGLAAEAKSRTDKNADRTLRPIGHDTPSQSDMTPGANRTPCPRKDPMKDLQKGSTLSFLVAETASPVTTRPRKPKAEAERPASSEHKRVVDCYFESFTARRGSKPVFGGAEGKAISRLMEKAGGAEAAIEIIKSAFAPTRFRSDTATILVIARDPSAFVGPPGKAKSPQQADAPTWQPREIGGAS